MQNKPFTFGPVALTTTYTTNILNPGTTTGGVNVTASPNDKLYILLRHLHFMNKTASAVTFRIYKGATGGNVAGTELFYDYSVPANGVYDWYGILRLDTVDFLVGGAGTTLALTVQGEGEIGVA